MEHFEPSDDYDRSDNRPHAVQASNADTGIIIANDDPRHSKQATETGTNPDSDPKTSADRPRPAGKRIPHVDIDSDFALDDIDLDQSEESIRVYVQQLSRPKRGRSVIHSMLLATAGATDTKVIDAMQQQTHRRRSYTTVALLSAPKMLLADIPSTASVAMSVIKMLAHNDNGHGHGHDQGHEAGHHAGDDAEHGIAGQHSDGVRLQQLNGDRKRGITSRLARMTVRAAQNPKAQKTVSVINDLLHKPSVLAGLTGLYGYLAISTGMDVELDKLPEAKYMFDLAKTSVYSIVAGTSGVSLIQAARHHLDKRHEEQERKQAEQDRIALRTARLNAVRLGRKKPRATTKWVKDENGQLIMKHHFHKQEEQALPGKEMKEQNSAAEPKKPAMKV